jgi:subfamily B ATP-binding cassette protein MsbA
VQEALDRLMQGRTTVIVAHRLSTIKVAHRIAVLDGGRMVELGTHDELLARNELFARLYRMQFRNGDEEQAAGRAVGSARDGRFSPDKPPVRSGGLLDVMLPRR